MPLTHLEHVVIDIATHDDKLFRQTGELIVHPHGQGNVRQSPGSVDADLPGILAHLLHHERRRTFPGDDRRVGKAFGESALDDTVGIVSRRRV